mgnify:CR=1 FL=1
MSDDSQEQSASSRDPWRGQFSHLDSLPEGPTMRRASPRRATTCCGSSAPGQHPAPRRSRSDSAAPSRVRDPQRHSAPAARQRARSIAFTSSASPSPVAARRWPRHPARAASASSGRPDSTRIDLVEREHRGPMRDLQLRRMRPTAPMCSSRAGMAGVHHVHQHVGVLPAPPAWRGRRATSSWGSLRMKPDRVGQDERRVPGLAHQPRRRIERDEELVGRGEPAPASGG